VIKNSYEPESAYVQAGDLVQLIDEKGHTFLIVIGAGEQLHTHRGILEHDALIGQPWGKTAETHTGYRFLVIMPSLGDLLLRTKRNTQIMYPKDIGFLMVNMGIGPGKRVVEAGTGSGALTTAFAYMVGSQGKVYSYEIRPEMQDIAIKNLERLGLASRVDFKNRDIASGFDENGIDALFLDLPYPEDFLPQVREALPAGKPFGSLVPTTNQVSRLINALEANKFGFIEVCELFLRYYKPVAERLRPTDRMVAHTGYLIFARPLAEDISFTAPFDAGEITPETPELQE
jgi:tRNA (adenine57-N1/adenine58-N1)-methyltransferase catalytic subunit